MLIARLNSLNTKFTGWLFKRREAYNGGVDDAHMAARDGKVVLRMVVGEAVRHKLHRAV